MTSPIITAIGITLVLFSIVALFETQHYFLFSIAVIFLIIGAFRIARRIDEGYYKEREK